MEIILSPYNHLKLYELIGSRYSALRVKQLLLLVTLGEYKSLRKVSELMAVTQPAATKALQEIEETLGVKLFERTTNGVVPSLFGVCAIEHASLVLATLSRMKSQIDLLAREGKKILRIGMVAGAASDSFGEIVGQLSVRDHLLVEAEEDTTSNLVKKLSLGELDCIFVKRSVELDTRAGIGSEMLRSSGVCVVASCLHPLQVDRVYDCQDLIEYPWIAYDANTPLSELLKNWFCQAIGQKPNVWMRTKSALTTFSALSNSNSLALLPMPVVLTMDEKLIKSIKTSITSAAECCVYWRDDSPAAEVIREVIGAVRSSNVVRIRPV
ncbi:HTH-type transcriptional regulator GbpR [compost metagenome]